MGRVWRTFCRPCTKLVEHYACRGTMLIEAANLSPVTNLVAGTGAVSRYKLSRRQKLVMVQDLNCVQMRVSGCVNHYEFVLGAGAKAKSVTNNLPILSVLDGSSYFNIISSAHIFHTYMLFHLDSNYHQLAICELMYRCESLISFLLCYLLEQYNHDK